MEHDVALLTLRITARPHPTGDLPMRYALACEDQPLERGQLVIPPGQRRAIVGLFWNPSCRFCQRMLEGVTRSYTPGSAYWLGSLTSLVVMKNGPTTKQECKNGGWKAFGFKNQGQCVKYVNHL